MNTTNDGPETKHGFYTTRQADDEYKISGIQDDEEEPKIQGNDNDENQKANDKKKKRKKRKKKN